LNQLGLLKVQKIIRDDDGKKLFRVYIDLQSPLIDEQMNRVAKISEEKRALLTIDPLKLVWSPYISCHLSYQTSSWNNSLINSYNNKECQVNFDEILRKDDNEIDGVFLEKLPQHHLKKAKEEEDDEEDENDQSDDQSTKIPIDSSTIQIKKKKRKKRKSVLLHKSNKRDYRGGTSTGNQKIKSTTSTKPGRKKKRITFRKQSDDSVESEEDLTENKNDLSTKSLLRQRSNLVDRKNRKRIAAIAAEAANASLARENHHKLNNKNKHITIPRPSKSDEDEEEEEEEEDVNIDEITESNTDEDDVDSQIEDDLKSNSSFKTDSTAASSQIGKKKRKNEKQRQRQRQLSESSTNSNKETDQSDEKKEKTNQRPIHSSTPLVTTTTTNNNNNSTTISSKLANKLSKLNENDDNNIDEDEDEKTLVESQTDDIIFKKKKHSFLSNFKSSTKTETLITPIKKYQNNINKTSSNKLKFNDLNDSPSTPTSNNHLNGRLSSSNDKKKQTSIEMFINGYNKKKSSPLVEPTMNESSISIDKETITNGDDSSFIQPKMYPITNNNNGTFNRTLPLDASTVSVSSMRAERSQTSMLSFDADDYSDEDYTEKQQQNADESDNNGSSILTKESQSKAESIEK
jgi:hypothetical protein